MRADVRSEDPQVIAGAAVPDARHGRLRDLTGIAALAGAYFITGKLGLSLAFLHESVTAVWPPTGVSLAVLLLAGLRLWPGVWIGAFLVNITTSPALLATIGIATGNTLECALGALLVQRFAQGVHAFNTSRGVFRFVLLACTAGTMVSATVGLSSLALGGLLSGRPAMVVWLTWWLGDAVSAAMLTPLIVLWATLPRPHWTRERLAEALLMMALLLLVSLLIFGEVLEPPFDQYVHAFMSFPAVIWAAFRFGSRGAASAVFVVAVVALLETLQGRGPLVHADLNDSLILLQVFIATISVTNLVLGAVVSERRRAETALQRSEEEAQARAAQLQAMLQAVPAVVWFAEDPEGRVISGNAASYELLRLPAGVNASKSAPPVERPEHFKVLRDGRELAPEELPVQRAARGEEIRDFEVEIRFTDDTSRHLVGNAAPLLDARGRPRGSVAAFVDITRRKQTELELAALKEELAAELANMRRLHQLGARLLQEDDLSTLLRRVLEAAMELVGADKGDVQLYDEQDKVLTLATAVGFNQKYLDAFRGVKAGFSSCGAALERGRRVIIEDVFADPEFADLAPMFAAHGFVAVQSTPLFSSRGRVFGILSTHHCQPHRPSERELRMLDLYAHQAERVIERKRAEQALRRYTRELADFFDSASQGLHWADAEGRVVRANRAELRMLGYAPDEYVGHSLAEFHVEPRALEDMTRRLRRGEVLEDYPARLRCRDGSVRDVLIDASVYRENGRFVHTRAFTRDVTIQKEAERRLAASLAISRILAESPAVDVAVDRVIGTICERLEWETGALWTVDAQAGVLVCRRFWHRPGAAVEDFENESLRRTFEPGIGLPGRIWAKRRPACIADVTVDSNFPRAPFAAAVGLRGAFGFPILLGDRFLGVMEFFSPNVREPDAAVLEMFTGIGQQLGQFLERKHAEEALAAKEAQLQIIADTTPIMLAQCSRDQRYLFVNRSYAELIGLPPEQIVGRRIQDVLGADAYSSILPYVESVLEGRTVDYETELSFPAAGRRLVHAIYVPERDEGQRVRGWLTSIADITERKATEVELGESLERSRIAQQATRWGVFDYNYTTGRNYWTAEQEALYGLAIGEFAGTYEDWIGRVHPEDRERLDREMITALETGEYSQDFRVIWPDGSVHWLYGRARVFRDASGRPRRMLGVNVDITERKRSEQAISALNAELARKINELNTLLEILPVGVWVSDPQSQRIFGNRAAYEMLGVPQGINVSLSAEPVEAMRGVRCRVDGVEITAPQDLPMQRVARTGRPFTNFEHDLIFPDGREVTIHGSVAPLFDEHGNVLSIIGAYADITGRRRAEQALRESQKRFAALIESAMDAIITVDARQNVVLFNPAAEQMFGCPAQDALGASIDRFIPAAVRAKHRNDIERFAATGVTNRSMGALGAVRGLRVSGEEFPIEASISQMQVGGQALFTVILRDITERRKAEDALQTWQRELESRVLQRTAELAAAHRRLELEIEERKRLEADIAGAVEREQLRLGQELHDGLGQHLTGIGFMMAALGARIRKVSASASREIERLRQLVQQSVELARNLARGFYPVELERHGLLRALEELTALAGQTVPSTCRVQLEGDPACGELKGPLAIQLFRIAQEAVHNAVKHARARRIHIRLARANGTLTLSVQDDGVGLPADLDQKRGMGLRIMQYRARLVGGNLEYHNDAEGGAVITCQVNVPT